MTVPLVASRPTHHSTGPARKAAQAGEFKRYSLDVTSAFCKF